MHNCNEKHTKRGRRRRRRRGRRKLKPGYDSANTKQNRENHMTKERKEETEWHLKEKPNEIKSFNLRRQANNNRAESDDEDYLNYCT